MNRVLKAFWGIVVGLLLFSCNNDDMLIEQMERIKNVGDTNPTEALVMLDSLSTLVRDKPERIVRKYDLLKLRLQDKAYIVATSDIVAKQLVEYYEKNGNNLEKQEAYYYAGSVYRDLQDTPRALEYFLKSSELAETHADCNSLILRNTYSNLSYLYYNVQDYQNAHKLALKEYEYSQKIGKTVMASLFHLVSSSMWIDNIEQAHKMCVWTFDTLSANPERFNKRELEEGACLLLIEFSYLKDSVNATKCFNFIEQLNISDNDRYKWSAYGEYYKMIGETDAAIHTYKYILQNNLSMQGIYDASRFLFRIYNERRDLAEACKYAALYIQISDSMDLGTRQRLAATVNNQFQYHFDKNKEQRILEERDKVRFWLTVSVISCFAIILLAGLIIIYKRNKHLQELLAVLNERNKLMDDKKELQQDINEHESELREAKTQLKTQNDELEHVKTQLAKVNTELENYGIELKEKERQLSERMQQNQTFLNLLHQSELEGHAEDVIYAIRQSSEGRRNMQPADWKQLYKAVDELYPTFKEQLLKELGTFTEQQMQVCYLLRIGLSKPQIQHLTNLSRVTVWRWVKKFEWVQGTAR